MHLPGGSCGEDDEIQYTFSLALFPSPSVFELLVEPRRTQTFSRDNFLDMLMPRHPATRSAMAVQIRMITVRIYRRVSWHSRQ
jgi:hypothetical protein